MSEQRALNPPPEENQAFSIPRERLAENLVVSPCGSSRITHVIRGSPKEGKSREELVQQEGGELGRRSSSRCANLGHLLD